MEWGQIEGGRFAHVWNKIVYTFREEDLISDRLCLVFSTFQFLNRTSRSQMNVSKTTILLHNYLNHHEVDLSNVVTTVAYYLTR